MFLFSTKQTRSKTEIDRSICTISTRRRKSTSTVLFKSVHGAARASLHWPHKEIENVRADDKFWCERDIIVSWWFFEESVTKDGSDEASTHREKEPNYLYHKRRQTICWQPASLDGISQSRDKRCTCAHIYTLSQSRTFRMNCEYNAISSDWAPNHTTNALKALIEVNAMIILILF